MVVSSNSLSPFPWVVAITGASGTCYGRRLLQVLAASLPHLRLELIISDSAYRVMREEEELAMSGAKAEVLKLFGIEQANAVVHSNRDTGASIASGSYLTSGMIIVPCSMRTLAAVSHGFSETLIHRAADVVLKERRKLILVPRESPLSAIHLENMLRLSKLGAAIVPAMPGFYNRPRSISDLVDSVVMRIVDQMGIHLDVAPRWGTLSDSK